VAEYGQQTLDRGAPPKGKKDTDAHLEDLRRVRESIIADGVQRAAFEYDPDGPKDALRLNAWKKMVKKGVCRASGDFWTFGDGNQTP